MPNPMDNRSAKLCGVMQCASSLGRREEKISLQQECETSAIISLHLAQLQSRLQKDLGERENQLLQTIQSLQNENRELRARLRLSQENAATAAGVLSSATVVAMVPPVRSTSAIAALRPAPLDDVGDGSASASQALEGRLPQLSEPCRRGGTSDRGLAASEATAAFQLPGTLRRLADEQDRALRGIRARLGVPAGADGSEAGASARHRDEGGQDDESAGTPQIPCASPDRMSMRRVTSTAGSLHSHGMIEGGIQVAHCHSQRPVDQAVSDASPHHGVEREFKPCPEFSEKARGNNRIGAVDKQGQNDYGTATADSSRRTGTKDWDRPNEREGLKYCVLVPGSNFFLVWNVSFCVVLAYEMLMFPMGVFDLPTEGFFAIMPYCTLTYWLLDFCLSFFTAYTNSDGTVVLNHCKIVFHYFKTWFIPDVIVVSLDILMLLPSGDGGNNALLRLGKVLRVLRVARVLRILRLRKLRQAMDRIDTAINSQYFTIVKGMVINMVLLLTIAHFLACLWWWIGSCEEGDQCWAPRYDYLDAPWALQYTISLHWALTQFTPGSMHVQPQSLFERTFAVGVLVMGLIVFSSIVSSITAAMNTLKTIGARYNHDLWLLRRYFRQEHISQDLLTKVTRYTDTVLRKKLQAVSLTQVELIRMLPDNLASEVHLELYAKHLLCHHFFEVYTQVSIRPMKKICSRALESIALCAGDELFNTVTPVSGMYVVLAGKLQYEHESTPGVLSTLRIDSWSTEAALWTKEFSHHYGHMWGAEDSDVMFLSSAIFISIVVKDHKNFWYVQKYATAFVRKLNELAQNTDVQAGPLVSDVLPPMDMLLPELPSTYGWVQRSPVIERSDTNTHMLRSVRTLIAERDDIVL